MIGMNAKIRFNTPRVRKAVNRGNVRSLGHAGARIRLRAKGSIRKRKGPSARGKPPHTHRKRLPRAILYKVEPERESAVIGPTYTKAGRWAEAHEKGRRYKGHLFPARPFMGPALEKERASLPKLWAGSVY